VSAETKQAELRCSRAAEAAIRLYDRSLHPRRQLISLKRAETFNTLYIQLIKASTILIFLNQQFTAALGGCTRAQRRFEQRKEKKC